MSEQQMAASQTMTVAELDPVARAELTKALAQLERGSGVLVRMADLLGAAMGRSVRLGARTLGIAPDVEAKVRGLAGAALRRAFDVAVLRMAPNPARPAAPPGVTSAVVMMSGAVGGFLGMGGFLPDVTVTTLAIMRAIARIAQEEGEDLDDDDTRRACLQVFALTPGGGEASESELGYFSARLMMQGRPMVMLFSEVASRYGLTVSQKFALQAVPVFGAISGAALNAAFLRHYRDLARAHFVVRRLERSFGAASVRRAASGA
jgi:hypothetical protein